VRRVVADTRPLHYLVLIEAIELLRGCLEKCWCRSTPAPVRAWLESQPEWLIAHSSSPALSIPSAKLGEGERAAIALATSVEATFILMDDRPATAVARAHGLRTIGTLGVLERAAALGMVDLPKALGRLRATNFRYRPELLDTIVARHVASRTAPSC
jgi:predicted nucleic acid-binding protein